MVARNVAVSIMVIAAISTALVLGVWQRRSSVPASPQDSSEGKASSAPASTPETQSPPPRQVTEITRTQFDALLYGMTYEQVLEILGRAEDDAYTVYDRGLEGYTSPTLTVWMIWKNADGSRLKLGFISNKLSDKIFEK